MTQIASRRPVAPLGISIVFLVLTSCYVPLHQTIVARNEVRVTGVTLNQTAITLVQNTTQQLTATVAPQTAGNRLVQWISLDPTLATVSATGVVTALGSSGKVTIKAVTYDGHFVALCDVTLSAVPIPLVGIAIHQTSLSLQTGTTSGALTVDYNPPSPTDVDFATLTWDTSDHALATVDATGAVTAGGTVTSGGVTVTASVKNKAGDLFHSLPLPLTITSSTTPVSSITPITPPNPVLNVGDQLQLTAAVNADASVQGVDWDVVTGGGVVHVDPTGIVHADGVGIATVRARAHGDLSFQSTTQVTVQAILVQTISFVPSDVTIAVNGSLDISGNLVILPSSPGPTNSNVTWSSSDEVVNGGTGKILVNAAGVVSVAPGAPASAVITAKAADASGVTGTCTVHVGNPVSAIAIGPMSLGLNETSTMTAVTTPPGGSVKWVTGTLVSGTPPTIDPVTGQVTAGNAGGSALVHAESLDGNVLSNEVSVTVYDLNSPSISVIPMIGGNGGNGEITQGNTLNNSGATMAVDPADGTVYVAYVDSSNVGYVQKAQGQTPWQPVGGNFADDGLVSPPYPVMVDSTTHALNLSLAIDQGILYVADVEGGGNFQFPIVRRFAGGNWIRVGTNPISVNGAGSYLSLGFDDTHNPFLGFSNQGASVLGRISVVLLSGGAWGAISTNSVEFSNPGSTYSVVAYDASHSLDTTGGSTPSRNYYVAFENQGSQALIDNFPASLFATVPAGQPMTYTDLTIQNGKLYLSYRDGSTGNPMLFTHAPGFGGQQQTHNMDNTTTNAQFTSVAVDPRSGTAYVAYANTSGFLRISKLDGNAPTNAAGTVIVSINDFIVNAIKTAFYVDNSGQGHLYVCYGLSGAGGVLVKDFLR